MSSNAALLDEPRAHALLEAGLQRIAINVGDRDDDYEDIYKLPFERTRDNVLRFKELAGDACEVIIVLVDHRRDRAHIESMRQYWGDFGIRAFMEYEIMNRGGALFVDHMQFEEYPAARRSAGAARRRAASRPSARRRSRTSSSATTVSTTSAAPTGRRKCRSAASSTRRSPT